MILFHSQAKAILDKALSFAHADETEVSLSGGDTGNTRFARNAPTTCGAMEGVSFGVRCAFGKKVGSYSTSQTDDRSLEAAVHAAEELARLSPENPEYMPRLGPQTYAEPPEWDEATARLAYEERARVAAETIAAAEKERLVAAGYYENGAGFAAIANSKGLFGYHTSTDVSYTLTVRTPDGKGSGWAAQESFAAREVDGSRITRRAIDKALRSRNPQPIEPGKYPVILEHSPAGDMLNLFINSLDRREADEGRSYFSDPKRGTKIGDTLFDDTITIYSDPANAVAPSSPWGEDGLPLGRTVWVERGVQKNLACSRYWAHEKNIPVVPFGSNVVMEGGEYSLDDLVASMEHGLLVSSFWYIREVDPQTIVYTGLTRDGLFMIENGTISHPVVNMRWNESPAAIYKSMEMLTKPSRIVTREGNMPMLAPAVKVKAFTFTSVSPST